jgi:hypothetical protein
MDLVVEYGFGSRKVEHDEDGWHQGRRKKKVTVTVFNTYTQDTERKKQTIIRMMADRAKMTIGGNASKTLAAANGA